MATATHGGFGGDDDDDDFAPQRPRRTRPVPDYGLDDDDDDDDEDEEEEDDTGGERASYAIKNEKAVLVGGGRGCPGLGRKRLKKGDPGVAYPCPVKTCTSKSTGFLPVPARNARLCPG